MEPAQTFHLALAHPDLSARLTVRKTRCGKHQAERLRLMRWIEKRFPKQTQRIAVAHLRVCRPATIYRASENFYVQRTAASSGHFPIQSSVDTLTHTS